MVRAISVAAGGNGEDVRDTLLLRHDQRRTPRGVVIGLRGTAVEIALSEGTRLHHDDCLLLDDGGLVAIVACPEPVIEVRTHDLAALARAAWLLGDHHIPVEIHARYLRVLKTPAAEQLLRNLEVTLRDIEAPFEPEGGAYDHAHNAGA